MTNKPMLSVELRALLERAVLELPFCDARHELRALLDTSDECRCKRYGKDNPHWPCSIHSKPAAQHQGEPVAEVEREFDNAPAHVHLYQDLPDGTKLYTEQPAPVAQFSDDTVVCRRYQLDQNPGQNFYHYDLEPVYGSVPVTISELIAMAESAPVAVVIPRKLNPESLYPDQSDCGWNDCIDEVCRLNGIKP